MMGYPPGTANDPRAPWNRPDFKECSECDGSGFGYDGDDECYFCHGSGQEPEPPEKDRNEDWDLLDD